MRDGDKKSTHIWCMFAPFFCSYYFSTIISNCRIFDITHRYVETQAVAIHVILPIDVDLRIARRQTEAEQWKKLCLLDWCYLTCVVLIALVKLRFGNAFSFRWLLFFVVFFFVGLLFHFHWSGRIALFYCHFWLPLHIGRVSSPSSYTLSIFSSLRSLISILIIFASYLTSLSKVETNSTFT